ncbi:MAG: dipeptide epimerase [Cyclobacteriaceae bacterium]|nr:dipeptide epimerase [Cyclobacteriaceae bacterium]
MKIVKVRSWLQDLDNKRPYTIAFKTVSQVRNAFVEIELENGIIGLGSGNPSQYVVGESLDECIARLQPENLEFLIGKDIREIQSLLWRVFNRTPDNPAARAALDIALHDAYGQHLGIPVWKYLGRCVKPLATSVTIGIKNVAETVAETEEYYGEGFRVIKVKLGLDVEEDIERMAKMRERYGDEIIIRIDANQGYDLNTTIDFFNRTKKYNIELIEQPIAAKAVDEMKSLPAEIREKIAADESIISAKDAIRLLDGTRACEIFNIKLMKCGGIFQGQRIASIARAADIDLMWGCNDESAVSITAALNVAYSFPNTKYIDLDGSLDLAKDVVKGGFTIKNGYMEPSDKPGFGFERID